MSESTSEGDWGLIEGQLPAGWRELGAQMGLAKRHAPQLGQKVLDLGIAMRMVLHYVSQRGSQRATIAALAAAGIVQISQVALFKWMKKIGPYLEALVARMVEPGRYASESRPASRSSGTTIGPLWTPTCRYVGRAMGIEPQSP